MRVTFEHARAHRINHKRQVNHGVGLRIAQQFIKTAAGGFLAQIHALELEGKVGLGRIYIHPDDRETSQQWQKPEPQVAANSGDHDYRFRHQFGEAAAG